MDVKVWGTWKTGYADGGFDVQRQQQLNSSWACENRCFQCSTAGSHSGQSFWCFMASCSKFIPKTIWVSEILCSVQATKRMGDRSHRIYACSTWYIAPHKQPIKSK